MKAVKLFSSVLVLILSPLSNAESCSTAVDSETKQISTDVPKKLESTIILVVRGTPEAFEVIGAMPIEEFKVVRRQREVLVTKQTVSCVDRRQDLKPNRVSVLGGQGPTGHLRTTRAGQDAEVESQVGLIVGLQYQRLVYERISIGAQVQDNETALSVIGFEF
jgi:hypothetical protein